MAVASAARFRVSIMASLQMIYRIVNSRRIAAGVEPFFEGADPPSFGKFVPSMITRMKDMESARWSVVGRAPDADNRELIDVVFVPHSVDDERGLEWTMPNHTRREFLAGGSALVGARAVGYPHLAIAQTPPDPKPNPRRNFHDVCNNEG